MSSPVGSSRKEEGGGGQKARKGDRSASVSARRRRGERRKERAGIASKETRSAIAVKPRGLHAADTPRNVVRPIYHGSFALCFLNGGVDDKHIISALYSAATRRRAIPPPVTYDTSIGMIKDRNSSLTTVHRIDHPADKHNALFIRYRSPGQDRSN